MGGSRKALAEEFFAVPLATLLANTIPDFALYLAKPGYGHVLYRQEGSELSHEHLQRLRLNHIDRIYIHAEDRAKQQRYMVTSARNIMVDPGRPSSEKAEMIYEFSKSAVQYALEEPREESVAVCRDLALEHVRYVVTDPQAMPNLLRIISYDYYTYTHSVNVCSFTVALCRRTGLFDLEQLKTIGVGAMLHDIGKSRIDHKILNKPGALTPAERAEIQRHPEYGVEVLNETSPVSPEAVELVLGHHEKCDGSGYPRGLTAEDTPLPVRACCIADIFDALTTHRSYKSAYAGFKALLMMQHDMHGQVDQDLLADLIRLVGRASQGISHQAA